MPYRTMCEVLDEMRTAWNTRNFAGMLGMIEEVRQMGAKMEAALERYKDKLEATNENKEG